MQSIKGALLTEARDDLGMDKKLDIFNIMPIFSETRSQKKFRIIDSDDEDFQEESKAVVESLTPTKDEKDQNGSETEIESNGEDLGTHCGIPLTLLILQILKYFFQ